MDFTELKDWILTICAGGLTLNSVVGIINLVKNMFGGLKVNKLMNFTAVADKEIKDGRVVFEELNKQFKANAQELFSDVKSQIVDPLKQEISLLVKDNTALANICVSLLSLVNVPVAQKREMFGALNKISMISSEAQKLFEASIIEQETQEATAKTDTVLIEQKIINS